MKKIYFHLLFLAGLVVISLIIRINESSAQTIRIANNNPDATPGVNVYTGSSALQNAISASVSGDIIYLTPSLTSYGTAQIVDKNLTIYGIGIKPELGGMRSEAGNIGIYGNQSGTRLSGLYLGTVFMASQVTPTGTVKDVTIDNCWMNGVYGAVNDNNRLENLVVRNCIMESFFFGGNQGAVLLGAQIENIMITNNIIRSECCSHTAFDATGITIQNNFIYYSGAGQLGGQFKHNVVQNNILYGVGLHIQVDSKYNDFLNNLFFGVSETEVPADGEDEYFNTFSNNIFGDPLPANFPGLTSVVWNIHWDVTPQAGSPVFGAGVSGVDIGPSGGPYPFDYEGTFLPLIQDLIVPGVIEAGQDLQITIKAKGN